MSRYARQIALPEIGPTGQQRLSRARVLVVGAGGLGAALLPLLVGAGIGRLRVIDPDLVEESNLHRQTLFRMSDIGRPKADAAAAALAGLNPDCRISPLVAWLDPTLARRELADADLVVDAADSFAVTYALSDLCLVAGIPFVSAAVLGRAGHLGGFCGGAPSYRAVFPDLPPSLQNCASGGVMGSAVASLGALQAQMALSVLLGHAPSPLGQFLSLDLATWRLSGFRFDGATEPERATPAVISRSEVEPRDMVIELRGIDELPRLTLPRARRLALAEATTLRPKAGQRVVFVCASGLRAWRAAQALEAAGHPDVAILAEGA
jgi:molybdopterin/thiamine biosynthesis adenylyltransferase